jgi:hypothetical protein
MVTLFGAWKIYIFYDFDNLWKSLRRRVHPFKRRLEVPEGGPRKRNRQSHADGAAGSRPVIEGACRDGFIYHAQGHLSRNRLTKESSSSSSSESSSDDSSDDTSSNSGSSSRSSLDSDSDSTSSPSSDDPPRHLPRQLPRPPPSFQPPTEPRQPMYVSLIPSTTQVSTVFILVDLSRYRLDSGSHRPTRAMSAVERSVSPNVRVPLPHRVQQAARMRYPWALPNLHRPQNRR